MCGQRSPKKKGAEYYRNDWRWPAYPPMAAIGKKVFRVTLGVLAALTTGGIPAIATI
jgi:hypothetical protein